MLKPHPLPTTVSLLNLLPETCDLPGCKVDFLGGYANVLGDLIHVNAMFSGLVPDSSDYWVGHVCFRITIKCWQWRRNRPTHIRISKTHIQPTVTPHPSKSLVETSLINI
jgi:hypothetical protein